MISAATALTVVFGITAFMWRIVDKNI